LGISSPYIFNIGGFDTRKNLPLLIEAFAAALPRLDASIGPVSLVIAGAPHSDNPTIFPLIEPVIRRLGVADRVNLVGRVRAAEKLALYQGAAVYCTPSLYEGFGLTPLEAMACGVPTIVSDRASLPEVVGDAGVIVPATVAAVAEALVRVLTDPGYAADLSVRAIKRAAEFSWEQTALATLEVYQEASGR
jgi:glycosyltransferase involved in cell wall biosynthesis